LHEGVSLGVDESFEFLIEGREIGVTVDGVEGIMIPMVTLVLPYVDFNC
jgi:hypothetical protein